jgi:hypothetical protein
MSATSDTITITRSELAGLFAEWELRARTTPEHFFPRRSVDPMAYGFDCADFVFVLHNQKKETE